MFSARSRLGCVMRQQQARRGGYSHHGAADERDANHKQPAGDDVKDPGDVSKGHRESELSGLAVERVEPGVEELSTVAIVLDSDDIVGGDGAHVEALLVDVNGGGLGQHLKDPDIACAGGPAVAEDGLVLAIDEAHVGGRGEESESGCRLVVGGLDAITVS